MSANVGEVVTRCSVLRLEPSGILHYRVKPRAEFTLADAQEDIAAVGKLGAGRRLPVLVDIREARAVAREARIYFDGPDTARVQIATAILVDSPLSRIIGNVYLALSAQRIPTRLFSSEAEALAWLQTFVEG